MGLWWFIAWQPSGTWGDIGTYSFDFAKTMTCGRAACWFLLPVKLRLGLPQDHGHENNQIVHVGKTLEQVAV